MGSIASQGGQRGSQSPKSDLARAATAATEITASPVDQRGWLYLKLQTARLDIQLMAIIVYRVDKPK
jgi:hypothetical protein